jgi:Spy/CpxP family protein refolding chaperone
VDERGALRQKARRCRSRAGTSKRSRFIWLAAAQRYDNAAAEAVRAELTESQAEEGDKRSGEGGGPGPGAGDRSE